MLRRGAAVSKFLDSWQEKGDRIIVFAGVFDPVHVGHIFIAKKARIRQNKILFIPERVPQHKQDVTAYEHRLRMLQIAVANEPGMEVLDYPGEHHYIKLLFSWLQEEYPGKNFSWLVGSDVLPFIGQWPDVEFMKELGIAEIIVGPRAESSPWPIKVIADVPVRKLNTKNYTYTHTSSSWVKQDLLHRHTSLPSGVYDYIVEQKLY